MLTMRERLTSKLVPDGDCLVYTGGKDHYGYGLIWNGKNGKVRSHRVAFELENGPIPAGLLIRHTCDNPPCCNPEHLILGTHADNMNDMVSRGRYNPQSGSKHSNAKLTEEQVIEIREKYAAGGTSHRLLAEEYGVSRGLIPAILHRRAWTHV